MKYAWSDLSRAFGNISAWSFLAYKQIQFEHRRSFMGSLWLIIAFGLSAGGIGLLMSQLQGRPMVDHVPYVMFGFAGWNFIIGCVSGGAKVMTGARGYLLQMQVARSVFVLSLVLRQGYVLVLNLGTAALVALWLGWRPSLELIWLAPSLGLYLAAGFFACLTTGLLAARVPDIGTLIESVMRLAFFFTPIIWHPGADRGEASGLIGILMTWNPFTHFIYVLRDGLLGVPQDALHWAVALGASAGLCVSGLAALQLLGRKITHWL